MYSIINTFRDVARGHAMDSFNDKQRVGNLMLAGSDIFVATLLTYLVTMMFTGGSGDTKDVDPSLATPFSVIVRATNEFNPLTSIGSMSWQPSWYKTTANILKNGPKVLGGSMPVGDFITKNFMSIKDWDGTVSQQFNTYKPTPEPKTTGEASGGGGATSNF